MQKIRSNKWIRYAVIIVLTALFLFGLSKVCEVSGELNALTNSIAGILPVIVTPLLLNYYIVNANRRVVVFSAIGGLLFSAQYVCGTYLFYKNYMFENALQLLWIIGLILCVSILTIPLVALLLKGADALSKRGNRQTEIYTPKKPWNATVFFLVMWAALFISFLPIFLCQWPGNFVFDAPYQMTEAITDSYKTHHPLLHTLLMGSMYKLGLKLGSVSLGFSFYTLIQMLILSSSFAAVMSYLRAHIKVTSKAAYYTSLSLAFVFFGVIPMQEVFAISATKDVLFAAFYLLFSVFLFRYGCEYKKLAVWQWILFFVSGCLLILFRKNALIAILPWTIVMCVAIIKHDSAEAETTRKSARRKALLFASFIVAMVVTASIANRVVIKSVNAYNSDGLREAMSIPLQQLARVAKYEKKSVPKEIYDEIAMYIPEQNIEYYNPFCSDPVKNEANERLLRDNIVNFVKLWVKVGIRYPDEYIESFLSNTMGYWYTQATSYEIGGSISTYHMLIGMGKEIEKTNYFPPAAKFYEYLYYYNNFNKTPVLALLFRPFLYFWMLGFYFLIAVYRKKYRSLGAMSLPLLYYATLFCGPMIAIRYLYNLVIFTPIMLLCFAKYVLEPNKEE